MFCAQGFRTSTSDTYSVLSVSYAITEEGVRMDTILLRAPKVVCFLGRA